jgi:hypothetical protein
VNPRIGWSQPPPGWDAPGWAPLVDPGPRSFQAARTIGRWSWPTMAVGGFLAVTGFVLRHDDPAPGLSGRGLLTVALAAAVVALLTLHRRYGPRPLGRALAEYAVVFALAVLVATTGVPLDQPPAINNKPAHSKQASAVPDQRPALVKTIDRFTDWLREWRQWARSQRDHNPRPKPTGEAMPAPAPSPTPLPPQPEVPRLMWSSLPSNLRTVLGMALLLGLGVAAAAFTLSFFALRDAAQDPALAWGSGHAWLFPIGVDMALVFFEVLLLGASMVRVTEAGRVVQYPRAIPFLLMLVAAAGTLYFNATHVPEQVRLIALAVPVASILVTLGLAYLLKMLAAASGAAAIHLAPPPLEPNRIVRHADVLHGELVRDPQASGAHVLFPPHAVYGQVPSSAPSQHGQNGPPVVAGDGETPEATKRHQVEAYLAALDPDQLARLTALGPRAAARELTGTLTSQGMAVSERYVQQILDDWTAATRQQANGRRRRR